MWVTVVEIDQRMDMVQVSKRGLSLQGLGQVSGRVLEIVEVSVGRKIEGGTQSIVIEEIEELKCQEKAAMIEIEGEMGTEVSLGTLIEVETESRTEVEIEIPTGAEQKAMIEKENMIDTEILIEVEVEMEEVEIRVTKNMIEGERDEAAPENMNVIRVVKQVEV